MLLEKRPLRGNFSKFCSERIHCQCLTDLCVVWKFREIWPTGNQWNRALLTWQKSKNSPHSPALATAWIALKICRDQCPTMYSECSRFHPDRFTFGGVIAERVNTVKTHRKAFPVFGWSLFSSRLKTFNWHAYTICFQIKYVKLTLLQT